MASFTDLLANLLQLEMTRATVRKDQVAGIFAKLVSGWRERHRVPATVRRCLESLDPEQFATDGFVKTLSETIRALEKRAAKAALRSAEDRIAEDELELTRWTGNRQKPVYAVGATMSTESIVGAIMNSDVPVHLDADAIAKVETYRDSVEEAETTLDEILKELPFDNVTVTTAVEDGLLVLKEISVKAATKLDTIKNNIQQKINKNLDSITFTSST